MQVMNQLENINKLWGNYKMNKSHETHHEQTLIEQHAFQRLSKVEEEQKSAYEKKPHSFPWKEIIMGSFFFIIFILYLIQNFIR